MYTKSGVVLTTRQSGRIDEISWSSLSSAMHALQSPSMYHVQGTVPSYINGADRKMIKTYNGRTLVYGRF